MFLQLVQVNLARPRAAFRSYMDQVQGLALLVALMPRVWRASTPLSTVKEAISLLPVVKQTSTPNIRGLSIGNRRIHPAEVPKKERLKPMAKALEGKPV